MVELSHPAALDAPLDFRAALVASLPQLRALAARLTPCAADASDLVQETCLRAIEKQHQFVRGSRDDLVRWLRTIMHHLRRDDLRRPKREIWSPYLDELAEERETQACAAWRMVDDDAVEREIRALPPTLREPYALFVRGLSYAVIADRLGMAERTVGTRIFRARERLRSTLRAGLPAADQGGDLRLRVAS